MAAIGGDFGAGKRKRARASAQEEEALCSARLRFLHHSGGLGLLGFA